MTSDVFKRATYHINIFFSRNPKIEISNLIFFLLNFVINYVNFFLQDPFDLDSLQEIIRS